MNRNLRNLWASFLFLPIVASCGDFEPEGLTVGYASSAIANGTVDHDDKFVVGIFADRGGMCSGSLIAPNVVLTARHCVARTAPGYVQCGKSPFGNNFAPNRLFVSTDTQLGQNSSWYGVSEVRTPTEGNDTCGYDVALLILSSNIPSSVTTPIEPRLDSPPERNELYSAVGYGMTCGGERDSDCPQGSSGTRRRQDGLKVSCTRGKCNTSWGIMASEWQGQKDVCSGDSGGPALDSQGRVIGVASRGGVTNDLQCVFPVYAGVDSWAGLIGQAVIDGAAFGGYTPPQWAVDAVAPKEPEPEPDAGAPVEPEPPISDDDAGDEDPTCTSHDDCGDGEVCAEGACIASCTTSACHEGNICNADTGLCELANQGDPSGDAVDDVASSWSCSIGHSTDPTKPVPWLIGLAMIPVLRRLRGRRS